MAREIELDGLPLTILYQNVRALAPTIAVLIGGLTCYYFAEPLITKT